MAKESDAKEIFLNRGIRTRYLTLQSNTAFTSAIDQVSFILKMEKAKTIIKLEVNEEEEDKIFARLKTNSALCERVNLCKFYN